MSWANLMLANMYEKLGGCTSGVGSFCFGSLLMEFLMENIASLHPFEVVVEMTKQITSWLW